MKRTNYEMCVNSKNDFRRVYEKDGKYFVKYNNQIFNVTDKQQYFMKTYIFN